jgi:hypothetical protein
MVVVETGQIWRRLAPGMLDLMDAPLVLAMSAPRPVCVVHGELDEACPIEGVEEAVSAAEPWYAASGNSDRLQLATFENVQDTVRQCPPHLGIDGFVRSRLLLVEAVRA